MLRPGSILVPITNLETTYAEESKSVPETKPAKSAIRTSSNFVKKIKDVQELTAEKKSVSLRSTPSPIQTASTTSGMYRSSTSGKISRETNGTPNKTSKSITTSTTPISKSNGNRNSGISSTPKSLPNTPKNSLPNTPKSVPIDAPSRETISKKHGSKESAREPREVKEPKEVREPKEDKKKKKKEKTSITDSKIIEELTKDCILIEKKDYNKVQVGDRIKYIRGKEYKDGGFVWYSKIGDKGRHFWMISPQKEVEMSNSRVLKFPLFWDKIDKLWVQPLPDFSKQILKLEIDGLDGNVESLKLAIIRQQYIIEELIKFLDEKVSADVKKCKETGVKKFNAKYNRS